MQATTIRKNALGLAVIFLLGGVIGNLVYSAMQKEQVSAAPAPGKPEGDGSSGAWWTVGGKKLSSGISQVTRRAADPLRHAAETTLAAVDSNVVHAGTGGSSSFHQNTVVIAPGGPTTVIGDGGSGGGGSGGGGGGSGGGGGGGSGGGGSNGGGGGGSGGGSNGGGGSHNVPESDTALLFGPALIWALRRRFRQTKTAAVALQETVEHP
jgi:hypothetical protein